MALRNVNLNVAENGTENGYKNDAEIFPTDCYRPGMAQSISNWWWVGGCERLIAYMTNSSYIL